MNEPMVNKTDVKLTKNKLVILQLLEEYKHLDVSNIHTLLTDQGVNISLATVYRLLAHFEENKIVIKHNFNEGQSIYELSKPNEHHDHLICIKCNKVIEFYNCNIEKTQEKIASENKFTIIEHHLNLYGICEGCII